MSALLPFQHNMLLIFQNPALGALIGLLALWVIPWKGVALWKAARNGDKVWFIVLLVVNTLAILEILYIFVFAKKDGAKEEKKPAEGASSPADGPHV